MSLLDIQSLTHRYPGNSRPAVDRITLELSRGEVLALIGGSGSGKSTLLRCIAGLETPSKGRITLGGRTLTGPRLHLPPERRRIGMVAQSGDLFPHLTVLKNTAFGLHRLPRAKRREQALDALAMVGLDGLADRYPAELSGGEAQRVALARSLATDPELILLDEPFSNLDASLRDHLRSQTLEVLRQRGITTIFVTHHGDDALAAGDRIAVLRDGRLVQCAPPRVVWRHPVDREVAALFGGVNLLPGAEVPQCLRPEELGLCSGDQDDCLACGRIERVDFLGSCQLVLVRTHDDENLIRVQIGADDRVETGTRVGIVPRPARH
ncbi:ABC transporter ATP-binding protein [Haloferula sp. A504]|uniref:ABC transporter ATP-binding protein n=1 Tax=Haloferula sp. A504 TaxID=3373601 RepID=UPI0031BBEE72|nr:ABC transporter ATP-binding protein [Verrucomicrobiaceae bacterium E54]